MDADKPLNDYTDEAARVSAALTADCVHDRGHSKSGCRQCKIEVIAAALRSVREQAEKDRDAEWCKALGREGLDSPALVASAIEHELADAREKAIREAAAQCALTCDAAPWREDGGGLMRGWKDHPPAWVVTRSVAAAILALLARPAKENA